MRPSVAGAVVLSSSMLGSLLFCSAAVFAEDQPLYAIAVKECRALLREHAESANAVCDSVLNREDISREGKTQIQLDYASLAITRGDFAEAERHLDDALLDNEVLRERNIYRYNLLRKKALINYRQDQFPAALPYMREALDVALAMQNNRLIATSYNDLGAVFLETGEYAQALGYLQKALDVLEKLENYYSAALTLANIANVYRDIDDLDSSIDYLQRAKRSHETHLSKNPSDGYGTRALAQVSEDLGISYTAVGDYANARTSLAEAYDTFESSNLALDQIRVLAALADVELGSNNGSAALALLNQALDLEQTVPPKRSIELRRGLVASYVQVGSFDLAKSAAAEGLTVAEESERAPDELYFLEQLTEISAKQGDQETLLAYQKRFFDLYKSSLDKRYQSRVAELQSSIEVRQQAQSIATLRSERESLQRSVRLQSWLIFGALMIVALLVLILVLVQRQRAVRQAYLDREIAIHRQEFESETPPDNEDEDTVAVASGSGDESGEDQLENPISGEDVFAVALVRLMRSCVEIWEQTSDETRIELAEKSRAWQVTIDNGRLRTRTMDRYCDLKKLPKVPRWRQVVRTCRYILINCELSDGQRQRLNDELEQVFSIQRGHALSE
ncbi:MAG: tetratricopeptide repeat protein [Pseudomonadota bacterium]